MLKKRIDFAECQRLRNNVAQKDNCKAFEECKKPKKEEKGCNKNRLRMTERQEIMVRDLCGVKFEFSCSLPNCNLPLMNG